MRRLVGSAASLLLLSGLLSSPAPGSESQAVWGDRRINNFKLIGHDPLMNRGMNAAIAVHGDYAYIGSRTDGTHPNAGVLVVDISHPRHPRVVHEIGPPQEGNVGETSRELRIWPEKDLLIVLNLGSNCSPLIHGCSPTSEIVDDNFRFYDISGRHARRPKLVSEYVPSENPHEFFLWDDPERRGRALMYMSTPGGDKQLLVTDISRARRDRFQELTSWTTLIPDPRADDRLHSLSISNDGRRGYLAYLGGGSFVIDTSELANRERKPRIRLVTPIRNRVHWGNPGAHSAVKLYGRPWMLVSDEVYGKLGGVLSEHGCPWGWVRMVNIDNPRRPRVAAHFKIRQNHAKYCRSMENDPPDRENVSSWSSHNPTLTRNLAFVSWHAGGLRAMNLRRPWRPRPAGSFTPEPLAAVFTEDPALTSGRDKVAMWSYPIIKNGLIYVVDLRNGLYILKYTGPFKREVARIRFIEGNSNLKTARRFERP